MLKSERDIAPDVLRGFALFGILVVNIPFMALSSENGAFGLLLIPFLFRTDRTLKIGTRIIYSLSSTILIVLAALIYMAASYLPEESSAPLPKSGLDEVLRNSTFLASIAPRVDLWAANSTLGTPQGTL